MVKKRFLPSKREKKRYLAFEIVSKNKIELSKIAGAISTSLIEMLGYEAHIKILIEKWNQENQRGIIKVNNKYIDDLKNALQKIGKADHEEIEIKSLGVSGILNKAEKRYLIAG